MKVPGICNNKGGSLRLTENMHMPRKLSGVEKKMPGRKQAEIHSFLSGNSHFICFKEAGGI